MKKSYDMQALDILMGRARTTSRQAELTALAGQARASLENRVGCPDCGHEGPHEDNGCTGTHRALLCSGCGSCFEVCS